MIQHLQCLSLWLIIKFQSNLQQLLAKHFASLWDCWDTLTGQNKYTDLLHKNTLLGEVWLILAKQKNHNYLREMYGDIFMNTHTNRNAYFNHLASAGTVSLSTICPFVSSSIVTFPRVCVCVCVHLCISVSRVCVCVITSVHTCLYIQCVLWLPNVHLVGEYCQGEVEVNSTQLNHWTALSWATAKAGRAEHNTMSSSGYNKSHWGLCLWM